MGAKKKRSLKKSTQKKIISKILISPRYVLNIRMPQMSIVTELQWWSQCTIGPCEAHHLPLQYLEIAHFCVKASKERSSLDK